MVLSIKNANFAEEKHHVCMIGESVLILDFRIPDAGRLCHGGCRMWFCVCALDYIVMF